MKLKPSMRSNRRYLLIKAERKEDIKKAILDYVGVLGLAKMSLMLVNQDKDNILISIDRKEVDNFRASIECSPYNIQVLRVSGTMKGVKKV